MSLALPPLRIDFLTTEETGLAGRLGLTSAANLELARLRDEHAARRLITLLEADELARLGLADLVTRAGAAGLDVLHAPIADGGVPPSPAAAVGLVGRIAAAMTSGETVIVHCRAGLGRTGTVAACTLVGLGREAAEAIAVVRRVRPGTVENARQEAFVEAFGRIARGRFAPPPAG
jgi:protein-tyrosine phosphatase